MFSDAKPRAEFPIWVFYRCSPRRPLLLLWTPSGCLRTTDVTVGIKTIQIFVNTMTDKIMYYVICINYINLCNFYYKQNLLICKYWIVLNRSFEIQTIDFYLFIIKLIVFAYLAVRCLLCGGIHEYASVFQRAMHICYHWTNVSCAVRLAALTKLKTNFHRTIYCHLYEVFVIIVFSDTYPSLKIFHRSNLFRLKLLRKIKV